MRQAVDELAYARLAHVLVAVKPGLSEVLGDRDIGRELAPARGHLGTIHAENDATVGVGDRARATLINDGVERVYVGGRVSALDAHAAWCAGSRARGRRLTRFFRARALVFGSFRRGCQPATAF